MEPMLQYRMKGIAIIVKEKMPHKRHFLGGCIFLSFRKYQQSLPKMTKMREWYKN